MAWLVSEIQWNIVNEILYRQIQIYEFVCKGRIILNKLQQHMIKKNC